MDDTKLRELLAELTTERERVRAEAALLAQRNRSLSQTIDGIEGLLRDEPSSSLVDLLETNRPNVVTAASPESVAERLRQAFPDSDFPRGTEGVRLVLMETGREMNTTEITEELRQRGWTPLSKNPENATSSNAARAVETMPDVHRRRGDQGAYLYWYEPPDEQAGNDYLALMPSDEGGSPS